MKLCATIKHNGCAIRNTRCIHPGHRVGLMLALAMSIGLGLGSLSASAHATELNIWVMSTTEQQRQDMEELLRPYKAKNPSLRVNVTVLQWDTAFSKITAAAASGQGPDLLELGSTWVAAVSSMGVLEPVSEAQQASLGGAKAFYPALWQSTHSYDSNKIYAIPWYAEARAAFYRTDVFKAAGVDPRDAFANWGSFKQALQKINGQVVNGKKIAALGYAGKNDSSVVHNLAPWIWNAGGDFLSADKKKTTINSPEALQAVNYYTSFAAEGLVPASALEKDGTQIDTGFYNGQYAVIFTGPWAVKSLTTPKARGGHLESLAGRNFAIAPYPAGLKGQQTFFSGSDLAVMKSSKQKDEAWKLLSYLVSHPAQVNFAQISSMLPSRIEAANDPALLANPHYGQFVSQIKNGRSYPSAPVWATAEMALVKSLGSMFDIVAGAKGKYSPQAMKEALNAAAKETNSLLAAEQ